MNRIIAKPQKIGEDRVRYRTRLEDSVEVTEGSMEWIARQRAMLEAILHSPELTYCGMSRWHRMTMFHDGNRWVVEAEAILNEGDAVAQELAAPAGTREPNPGAQ